MPMMEAIIPKARATSGNSIPAGPKDAVQSGTKYHSADILRSGGFEQVGAASRAVTDVVTDEIGDDGRVSWVVLGDPRFNLTDKVRPRHTSAAFV